MRYRHVKFWLFFIYFLSGACSLMDELVWLRLLKLVFGNTVYAATVVVSVFMGGLALGSLVMGKYASRAKRPLRLYAQLEVVISLTALMMPAALKCADVLYQGLWPSLHATGASAAVLLTVQFLLSALLLLVPTFLMGASFPLLGRYVNEQEENAGHSIGGLYAANTLGAFVGCLLAGFVIIKFLGLHATLYTAVALNFGVAAAAWLLSTREEEGPALSVSSQADQPPRLRGALPLLLPAVFFVSGLAAISYEVIWLQSVIYVAGHSTYVFSGVLLVYLLGNVIGATVAGRLSLVVRRPAAALALSLLAVGAFGVLHVTWQDRWALLLSHYVRPVIIGPEQLGGFRAVGTVLLNCFVLFLPAAIAMGAGYPFALQAWKETGRGGGRTAGTVAGINTAGGVLGGIITTFFLLPGLGLQRSVFSVSLLVLFLAFALWLVCEWRSSAVKKWVVAVVPMAAALHVCLAPADLFYRQFSNVPGTELIHVREGVGVAVSVHQRRGDKYLALAGAYMSGEDMPEGHMLHGHLGPLLSANVERAMFVGFGTGITVSSAAKHGIKEIEVIERHPELLQTALEFFPGLNGGVLPENMKVYHLDARNYAHIADGSYDLITTDANAPKRWANSGELYTIEYFQKVRELLRPGGKHVLWLPLWLPPDCVESILGSFMDVFPHTTVWHQMQSPLPFFYIVGSNEPQVFSPELIDRALGDAEARPRLQAIFLRDSRDVLVNYFADERDLRALLTDYEVNSDWSPFIEFNTGEEEVDSYRTLQRYMEIRDFNSLLRHLDLSGCSEQEKRAAVERYREAFLFFETVIKGRSARNPIEGLICLADAATAGVDYPFLNLEVENKRRQAAFWTRLMIDHGLEAEISGSLDLLRSRYPEMAASLLISVEQESKQSSVPQPAPSP